MGLIQVPRGIQIKRGYAPADIARSAAESSAPWMWRGISALGLAEGLFSGRLLLGPIDGDNVNNASKINIGVAGRALFFVGSGERVEFQDQAGNSPEVFQRPEASWFFVFEPLGSINSTSKNPLIDVDKFRNGFGFIDDGNFAVKWYDGSSFKQLNSSVRPDAVGKLYTAVFSRNGDGTRSIYINGEQTGTDSDTTDPVFANGRMTTIGPHSDYFATLNCAIYLFAQVDREIPRSESEHLSDDPFALLRRRPLLIPVSSGGETATVSEDHQTTSVFSARLINRASVLESVSNQDIFTGIKRLSSNISEILDYQDSISSVKKIVASVTESLVSEDTSSKRSNLLTDLSDNTSYTDLEQARINLFASLVDAYVAGESWAATAFMIAQQDEVLTTQDLYSATITGINEGLVSEQSQFFDSFLTSAHMLGLVTNTQSIGDVVVAVAKISRFVFENLQTTDQYTTLLGSVGNVNENLTLTEVKQAQINLLSSLVDGYTAGDSWASTAFLIAQKSESIQTSDSYSADLFLLENNIVSEQTTYLSSFIASAQMLGIVTENQSIADVAIAVATISRNISETLSVGDMYTSVVKVVRQVLETTSYSDSFTAVLTTTTEQLFEDMEFIDLISGQTQLRAIVSEQIVWSDSYTFPTAIGMIQAVIAIKTYIDATLGINK